MSLFIQEIWFALIIQWTINFSIFPAPRTGCHCGNRQQEIDRLESPKNEFVMFANISLESSLDWMPTIFHFQVSIGQVLSIAHGCCFCHRFFFLWARLFSKRIITHIKVYIIVAGILSITQLLHSLHRYKCFSTSATAIYPSIHSIHLHWMRMTRFIYEDFKKSKEHKVPKNVCIMAESMCHFEIFQIMNVQAQHLCVVWKLFWFSVYYRIIQCVHSLAHIFPFIRLSFFEMEKKERTITDHHHR